MRRLSVNADDFGMTPGASAAVLHLRACDTEGVVPKDRLPDSLDRVLIEGRLAGGLA